MDSRLLSMWFLVILACVVYVKSEWEDPGPLLRSPFAPPLGHKKSHGVSRNQHNQRTSSDNHGHKNKKHVHHDPRGDKIVPVRKKVSGKCGGTSYVPRTHICCNGKIIRRQGMRPACCGDVVYDYVFDLCCDKNEVRPRTVGRPFC